LNPNRGGHVGNATSCLGIQVKYTNYCFKGAEEHGLEVTSIDTNSPAEKAGLKATGDKGAMIAAAQTASAFLGPLQLWTNSLFEKAAQGDRGDLIVAVDDQRIRSQADFDDAMAKARPGDTMYLTVIRPLPGGDHKTMRIAVNVGKWQSGTADSCTEATTASSQPASPR
jgi:S1-C subfamily serine protease